MLARRRGHTIPFHGQDTQTVSPTAVDDNGHGRSATR